MDIISMLDNLSIDFDSDEQRQEMKKYYKWLHKHEEKSAVELAKKNQVEYFKNILDFVKKQGVTLKLSIFLLCMLSVDVKSENVNPKTAWWQTGVFYQVYVRIFTKLNYLKDLGVDALILSPIYKSPMHDFGFDVSDFYSIQSEYGSMEDFEILVKKAEELDIKVILDFVPNHTSNESEWFIKSMHQDEYFKNWYIWENGHLDASGQRRPPNNWISPFRKSAWSYAPSRDQFYLHQFEHNQILVGKRCSWDEDQFSKLSI
ncbi:unnamed protein product [Leptidea sinapis]|uniref:alpha-glucosidase n=1 Tax=Leptidea sinapis TaxID=189913 RepID=A0A5E4R473_9NEOP|nr:unnamed protein product [Leptidea sinapis]